MNDSVRYTVAEIAQKRGVSERAIYKQMKTHADELVGHIEKIRGKQWLDEYAVKLLEDASYGSAPVVVEETAKAEMLAEIERLKKEIERLNEEHNKDVQTIRTMAKLVEINNENVKLIAESKLYIEQRDNAKREVDELRKEVESFQKTFFGLYIKK